MSAKRQFILGVFFVVALSILAFYTLFLTDFSLFGKPITLAAEFPDANALREGDPVLLAGKRIGRVKEILYQPERGPERRIKVLMNLDQAFELTEGYEIAIEDSTFLGGHDVAIDPGPMDAPRAASEPGNVYRGIVRKNPLESLEVVGNLVAENSGRVSEILDGVATLVGDVREGPGLVHRMLYDEALANDASAAIADVRATTAELRASVEALRAGQGTLGRLLADDKLYTSAVSTVESLQTIVTGLEAGQGVLGALLADDPLAQELRAVVNNLANLTRGLQEGEGLLGRMLKDDQLADEIRGIVTNFLAASEGLRIVGEELKSGEGSLSRLLSDPELYQEALTALKLITRSLEDYRESAPVSAFTSAIFGVL
jgi:phospholipid/cholesterol/gamma-HCH transport system substrate-binding protein